MFVLAAIAVLGVLIVVHELGHFLAARLQGIHVNRFSIGFGPVLLRYQGPKTEYALRALPLGGYVGFPDDDPDSTIPPNDPDLLKNRPVLDRAIVISAGVIANIVFAYLILVALPLFAGIPEAREQPGILVQQVMNQTSSAAKAGIKAGDVVLAADGQSLSGNRAGVEKLRQIIQGHPGRPVRFTLQRDRQQRQVEITPDSEGKIGVSLTPNQAIERRPARDIGEVFQTGSESFGRVFSMTFESFQMLFSGKAGLGEVAGPVGIVAMTANLAQSDITNLFFVAALISVNLAIINILPLPALDGGHLAFLFIEAVRGGKPLPSNIQEKVMQTGLVVLLGLALLLIFKDSLTLLRNGGSMLP
ncbi:RIP metalloprotease RseP [Gloeobacter kilaueensis]|uniref:Zinc metalloprotease n=1 Tax=Gloeobacter kilaueensis (strain ATCC BAA-2537 / CCAP 1431/1 / ULC 316 / JS1) TaxID=1183438 RepID=U5QDS6_GLOK1|nr:RIP metalloprotease RseP [Gloeobacter kilaueensis]AGY57066.1 membrane-associated zinc metalloprotease [Gloeobacter kilaueensis JS1]